MSFFTEHRTSAILSWNDHSHVNIHVYSSTMLLSFTTFMQCSKQLPFPLCVFSPPHCMFTSIHLCTHKPLHKTATSWERYIKGARVNVNYRECEFYAASINKCLLAHIQSNLKQHIFNWCSGTVSTRHLRCLRECEIKDSFSEKSIQYLSTSTTSLWLHKHQWTFNILYIFIILYHILFPFQFWLKNL